MKTFAAAVAIMLVLVACVGAVEKQESPQNTTPVSKEADTKVSLEDQVATLAELGMPLNEGITVDDLLITYSGEEYESEPYDHLLFVMGIEVEGGPNKGRRVCDRVWYLDQECIEGPGDYVRIAEGLCRVAGMPDLFSEIKDQVDWENQKAWLKYTVDGEKRHIDAEFMDDWADPELMVKVMNDIERDGKRFYAIPNGQGAIWFYLDEPTAKKLQSLTSLPLS